MNIEDIIAEIVDELKIMFKDIPNIDDDVLSVIVKDAYRKVRARRCYEYSNYSNEMIMNDMYNNYYQSVKDVAAYNFAKSGADFEISHSENSTSRSWVSENEILGNVIAFVKVI